MLTDIVIANKSYARYLVPENSRLDPIAMKVIKQDCPDFLMPIRTVEMDGQMEVRYELTGGIRMEYCPQEISKKDYYALLIHLLEPFKLCGDWFLDYHCFLLDRNYIFVDRGSQAVKYVYIPERGPVAGDEQIRNFFMDLIIGLTVVDDERAQIEPLRILKGNAGLLSLLEYFQKQQRDLLFAQPAPAPSEPVKQKPARPAPVSENVAEKQVEKPADEVRKALFSAKPKEEKRAEAGARPGTNAVDFGKEDVQGRLMNNLFGEEEPPKTKEKPKRGGVFSRLKGKAKKDLGEPQAADEAAAGILEEIRALQPKPEAPVIEQEAARPVQGAEGLGQTPYTDTDGEITTVSEEEAFDNHTLRLRLEEHEGCTCPPMIEISLKGGAATIGRANKNGEAQADFNFDMSNSFISRIHCRVERNGDSWKIVDLNSTNGTYVNHTKIAPNIPYPLKQNDVIAISCNKRRLTYRVC